MQSNHLKESIGKLSNDLLSAILIILFLILKTFVRSLFQFFKFCSKLFSFRETAKTEHQRKVSELKKLLNNAQTHKVKQKFLFFKKIIYVKY